jgi:hypothetical protein
MNVKTFLFFLIAGHAFLWHVTGEVPISDLSPFL